MNIQMVNLILSLVALALEKGVPEVMALINSLNKEEVTLEDIKALHDLVKPPETY